jgi:hypothetical protein
MRRLSVISLLAAVALVLAAAAVARTQTAAPHLVARAQGTGSAVVKATTTGLHYRLWLYRIGGSGPAHAKGTGTCRQGKKGPQTTWSAGFEINPNQRRIVWSRIKSLPVDCSLKIAVRGTGRIHIQLRGS